jgi:RecA-family ATPase
VTTKAPHVSEIARQRVRWLWEPWMPLGKITVEDGDPGLGKSTVAFDIAARLTTGSPLPDRSTTLLPVNVLLMTAEDDIADTVRPRLEAAGANLDRVTVLQEIDGRLPEIPGDLERIGNLIAEDEISLVIVDPLMAYLGGKIDSSRDQDVRRALHPMKELAESTFTAWLLLRHLNKTMGSQPLYRGGGSIGIIGAARAGILVTEDPEDESCRVMAVSKQNLAASPQSLRFRIVNDERFDCARVQWLGTSQYSARQLLEEQHSDEEGTAMGEAVDFLREHLDAGPKGAREVLKEARDAGISESTLRRAASKRLRIKPRHEGTPGSDQRWVWELPQGSHHDPKISKIATFQAPTTSNLSSHERYSSSQSWDEFDHLREEVKQSLDAEVVTEISNYQPKKER